MADAELVDIDKAKPLSALAMDVEWGEQQLKTMQPELREMAKQEAIRQMAQLDSQSTDQTTEGTRLVADCRAKTEGAQLEGELQSKGGRGPECVPKFIAKFEEKGSSAAWPRRQGT